MIADRYSFPVRLKPDEAGRLVVHFPDLPEALTDGGDVAEALAEAVDCLSEALAGRINRSEEIPSPSRPRRSHYLVAPDPTMALKAALYSSLPAHGMTVADLARRLDIDHRQAARLIDPRAKYFLQLGRSRSSFSVAIADIPTVVANSLPLGVVRQVSPQVIDWVSRNKDALLDFWHHGDTWTQPGVNDFIQKLQRV